jgi:hypothetical protein
MLGVEGRELGANIVSGSGGFGQQDGGTAVENCHRQNRRRVGLIKSPTEDLHCTVYLKVRPIEIAGQRLRKLYLADRDRGEKEKAGDQTG